MTEEEVTTLEEMTEEESRLVSSLFSPSLSLCLSPSV